jgi:hypothetical protein
MASRIVRSYTAQYPDPIVVAAGTRVPALRQDDEYPGWWWCRGPDGREGWIPAEFLILAGTEATLVREYDAHELSVAAGEEIEVHEQVAGWARVTNRSGVTGWIPTRCLGGTEAT